MSSTYTISRTMSYVQQFIRKAPLTFSGTNDPAFAIGDWVRNLILGPPFAWRWNRNFTSTTCVVGQNDYQINLPTFGWLEQVAIRDTSTNPNTATTLSVKLVTTQEVTNNQPTNCAPWLDDNNGNITFRLTPPPDKTYTLNLTYQNASPIFKTLNDTWAPIPDYMQYVVQELYLAKAYQYNGDSNYAATMQMAVRSLLAASTGLDETQRNIFIQDLLVREMNQQTSALSTQYGNQSRSLI